MANMHLVTGYAGREHVTSIDQGLLNAYFFGNMEAVLERGSRFAASIISNNIVRVQDGDLMMQGRFARLNENSYVDLTIENGTQGYFRNDLIVARYFKDVMTGVETADLVVIKGENATIDPVDPAYTKGNILDGTDFQNDIPLWRVSIEGLTITGLTPLYSTFGASLINHANRHGANGSDPITSISADALCDIVPLEKGGTGVDSLESLKTMLGLDESGLRAELVEYTGFGKTSASKPVTITFQHIPKFLLMTGSSMDITGGLFSPDTSLYDCGVLDTIYKYVGWMYTGANKKNAIKKSEDGKTISWYFDGTESSLQGQYSYSMSQYIYRIYGIY